LTLGPDYAIFSIELRERLKENMKLLYL